VSMIIILKLHCKDRRKLRDKKILRKKTGYTRFKRLIIFNIGIFVPDLCHLDLVPYWVPL